MSTDATRPNDDLAAVDAAFALLDSVMTPSEETARPARVGVGQPGVMSRWRELLVHLVDLDAGVGADELPADYVARDAEWLAQYRTRSTWPDASG